ncbi:hypothetical protein, partial [Paraburkholderia sp. J63]|uniref:hypothetical protein n=1 Tax=Paraburkholderia sp. J63 TaxID=2805434 RepID=UPI002ABD6D21
MSLRISHQHAPSAIKAEASLATRSNTKSKRTNGHQQPAPISPEALAVDATRVRIRHWLFLLGG